MSSNFQSSTATIDIDFDPSEFAQALAEEGQSPNRGSKVDGKVVAVTDREVVVNINYKAEGRIPRSEFGDSVPGEGDQIQVIFKGEDEEGNVRVSYADLQRSEIEAQLAVGKIMPAKVSKLITRKKDEEIIPAGYSVELAPGITAFVPLSQIDLYPGPSQNYLGKILEFRIERIESKGRHQNIVANRRKLLEEEQQVKLEAFFAQHEVGDVVRGQVRSFVNFGAFIDLGGFSGLLHLVNMAWHSVKRAQDCLTLGEEIELQIVDLDQAKKKIGLSRKAMQPNPWDSVSEKFEVGQIVPGRVMRLQTYGAFVELEPGIEALVHISEMSWIKQIKHPREVLAAGDQVKVQVLEMDAENQRIRLGLRQAQPNPWLEIAQQYPSGTRLTLPVKNVTKSGIFLTIAEGIDGFLHQDDLSWVKRIAIGDVAKVGEKLEVVVLNCDAEERRIRLGLKQLEANPWQELKKYKKGTVIEGSVSHKTDFGIFVTVEGGIEGLVHKNDFTNDRRADREELLKNFQQGDKVRTLIVEIDEKKRRLGLSIKALERREEERSLKNYVVKGNDDAESAYTIGDALQEE